MYQSWQAGFMDLLATLIENDACTLLFVYTDSNHYDLTMPLPMFAHRHGLLLCNPNPELNATFTNTYLEGARYMRDNWLNSPHRYAEWNVYATNTCITLYEMLAMGWLSPTSSWVNINPEDTINYEAMAAQLDEMERYVTSQRDRLRGLNRLLKSKANAALISFRSDLVTSPISTFDDDVIHVNEMETPGKGTLTPYSDDLPPLNGVQPPYISMGGHPELHTSRYNTRSVASSTSGIDIARPGTNAADLSDSDEGSPHFVVRGNKIVR